MLSKALLSIALLLATIVLNDPTAEARHGNRCDNGFRFRNQASLSPQTMWMARNDVPFKRARRMSNEGFNRADRQMYRAYTNDDNCGWRSNRAWNSNRRNNVFCNSGDQNDGRRVAGRFSRRWF